MPQASIREAARAAAEQREHEARTFTEARTAVNDQLAEVRSSSFEAFFESIQLLESFCCLSVCLSVWPPSEPSLLHAYTLP